MRTHLYDLNFSVSIEDLPIAKKVAAPLESLELRIHNDRFEELSDPEKDLKRRIFQDSEICVAFVSREYLAHPFTRMEYEMLLKRAKSDPEKVYFFLLDEVQPDLPVKNSQIFRLSKTSAVRFAKHLEHQFFAPEQTGTNISMRKLVILGILLLLLLSALGYVDLNDLFASSADSGQNPATTKTHMVQPGQVQDRDGISGARSRDRR